MLCLEYNNFIINKTNLKKNNSDINLWNQCFVYNVSRQYICFKRAWSSWPLFLYYMNLLKKKSCVLNVANHSIFNNYWIFLYFSLSFKLNKSWFLNWYILWLVFWPPSLLNSKISSLSLLHLLVTLLFFYFLIKFNYKCSVEEL